MTPIPDDPIVSCIMRTGLPPWELPRRGRDDYDEEDDFGCEDEFYGNATEDF